MRWPRLMCSPSSTLSRAPYWMRCTARSVPSGSVTATIDVAAHHDQIAVRIADDVAVLDPDRAVEVRLDERLLGDLRRAADMERAHGELRARLADRLRGDDADRLAHIDRRAARKIAPIALAANAVLGLAGQHRADVHLMDAGSVELLDCLLVDQRRRSATSTSCSTDRARPRPRCGRGCGRQRRDHLRRLRSWRAP